MSLGELCAGNALTMGRNEPNRHEPLLEGNLAILKNGPDFDGKSLPTIAALVRLLIGEMIDFCRAAMRAKSSIFPADSLKMLDAGDLVRERQHQVKEAIKLLDHGITLSIG